MRFPRHISFAFLFGHAHPAQYAMRENMEKPVICFLRGPAGGPPQLDDCKRLVQSRRMAVNPIQLIRGASPAQRRTLVAAALGWMLDSFDAMLYALVLAYIMRDLAMSKATAGLLNSLTLLASGMGGVLFGFFADHIGRKRALMLSILTYSLC